MASFKFITFDEKNNIYSCREKWDISHLESIEKEIKRLKTPQKGSVTFLGNEIISMDSAGAWQLSQLIARLDQFGIESHLQGFAEKYLTLIQIVKEKILEKQPLPSGKKENKLETIGKISCYSFSEFIQYLSFVGLLSIETLRIFKPPFKFRMKELSGIIYRNGFQALPIIALLSFMIGIVITYQMAIQLRNYGADAYVVDFLGLSVLREFGPLLTAIMVAGRTGSAFTAQLGIMKINEEIDALSTMGVTPAEILLLPRIFGLMIALPLLTMWANVFGVIGGMLMANTVLHISAYDFIHRFSHVIPLKTLFIGLGKTPIFALLIASIGTYEGMRVKNNALSVGENTTRSVVLSIFFIIVADAIFSVIFSKLSL